MKAGNRSAIRETVRVMAHRGEWLRAPTDNTPTAWLEYEARPTHNLMAVVNETGSSYEERLMRRFVTRQPDRRTDLQWSQTPLEFDVCGFNPGANGLFSDLKYSR